MALIERADWGAGTSSRSTKLLHGGVRYLEQAITKLDLRQLRQVKHGLQERKTLIQAAPFLARPLALATPVFSWFEAAYLLIGLRLYGLIAGRKDHLPRAAWLSKKEAQRAIPILHPRIKGAVRYFDGQFDDARYVLLLVLQARAFGAVCMNYTVFTAFGKSLTGAITSVWVTDALTGKRTELHTKHVLNCTGPYSDRIRQAANADLEPRLTTSKGIHLSLPLPPGMNTAIMIPKTPDGRVLFAIPFQDVLLLGTTDTTEPVAEQEPLATAREAHWLLEGLNRYLARPITFDQIKASFAGLRPLVSESGRKGTKTLLRDHTVEVDEQSGLVSLLGGKWTTYRLMAKDAIDEICRRRNTPNLPCVTDKILLPGAEDYLPDTWKQLHNYYADQITPAIAQALCARYGADAYAVMQLCSQDPTWSEELCEGCKAIQGEVIWQLRREMVRTIDDVLSRRLRLEFTDLALAEAAAPVVGRLMAWELGWDETTEQAAVDEYLKRLNKSKL